MQNKTYYSLSELFTSAPVLSALDIHIWSLSLDLPVNRIQTMAHKLSAEETKRAAGFRFERDRKRYIARRAFLRMILGYYLDCEPRHINFSYGPYGKPRVQDDISSTGIHFNLSHSNGLALFAVTRDVEIGIDLEMIKPLSDLEGIVTNFFSPSEIAEFYNVAEKERLFAFYNCWTRKEAFIKAIGKGLTYDLSEFDVSLAPDKPARILSISGNTEQAACWSLAELNPASDFVAAIAYKGQERKMVCLGWAN